MTEAIKLWDNRGLFLCCTNGTYLLKNLVAGPFELGSPPFNQLRPDFSELTLYRLASP